MIDLNAVQVEISAETRALLEHIDQDRVNLLMTIFASACRGNKATTAEIMWAVAQIEARVIATFEIGKPQEDCAGKFSEMLAAALPAAILMLEHAKMEMRGGKPS